jgi:rhamnogalacturonan II specific xylosyltransferase
MIYLRPTSGAKLLLKKWIDELQEQPWSKKQKSNDQPAFNWALKKTVDQVHFSSTSLITLFRKLGLFGYMAVWLVYACGHG